MGTLLKIIYSCWEKLSKPVESGVQQPVQGLVGFLVGEQGGEALVDDQSLQAQVQTALGGCGCPRGRSGSSDLSGPLP